MRNIGNVNETPFISRRDEMGEYFHACPKKTVIRMERGQYLNPRFLWG